MEEDYRRHWQNWECAELLEKRFAINEQVQDNVHGKMPLLQKCWSNHDKSDLSGSYIPRVCTVVVL